MAESIICGVSDPAKLANFNKIKIEDESEGEGEGEES